MLESSLPDEKLGQKWASHIQKTGDHGPSQTSFQCFDPSIKSLGLFPCCQSPPSALLKTQGQASARLFPLQVPLFRGLLDGLCVSVFTVVFAALYYGCVLTVSSYRLRGSLKFWFLTSSNQHGKLMSFSICGTEWQLTVEISIICVCLNCLICTECVYTWICTLASLLQWLSAWEIGGLW